MRLRKKPRKRISQWACAREHSDDNSNSFDASGMIARARSTDVRLRGHPSTSKEDKQARNDLVRKRGFFGREGGDGGAGGAHETTEDEGGEVGVFAFAWKAALKCDELI